MNAKSMQPTTWPTGRRARFFVCLLLLVSCLSTFVAPAPVVAQSAPCDSKFGGSMVGYWRYDNSADPMAPTYGSLRGSTIGALPLSSGKIGQALTFNGGAYVNYGTGLDIPAWEQYTVAIWFLNDGRVPPQIGYGQKIIDKTTMFSDFFLGVQNSPNPTQPRGLVFMYDRDFKNLQTSGYDYVDGQWHQAVILKNGHHGELWVDGVLIGAKEDVNPTINNQPLWMGYSSSPDIYQRQYWGGLLDEFAVFNRALTAEEITDLYQTSASGSPYCSADPDLLVNSTADPGDGLCNRAECTLREAIIAANAHVGTDPITFNIPGAGPHTIRPATPLPVITDAVLIDGYSQPGARPATSAAPAALDAVIMIEVDGSRIAPGESTFGEGIRIETGHSIVRGLAINRFVGPGILIRNVASENLIIGNFIGTDPGGTLPLANGRGIELGPLTTNGLSTRIEGNLIAGNSTALLADQAGAVTLINNRIGSGLQGQPLANGGGILLGQSLRANILGNLIAYNQGAAISGPTAGGSMQTANNIIEYNGAGIACTGALGCVIRDNRIANNRGDGIVINVLRNSNLERNTITANGGHGVSVFGGSALLTLEDNTITTNVGKGLVVVDGTSTLAVSLIGKNAIAANGGLGIDLGDNGVTPNDLGDSDSGPNGLQNFPELPIAENPTPAVVEIRFNGLPNTPYRFQIFANEACDPSGHGEGQSWWAETADVTDANGNLGFVIQSLSGPALPTGYFMTAVAIDPNGRSSEFSACAPVTALVNALLKLERTKTSYNPTDPRASAGVYTIIGTFRNQSSKPLTYLYFKSTTLAYRTSPERPAGLALLNGEYVRAGSSFKVTVPGTVAPGALFDVTFDIGLPRREPFDFVTGAWGVPGDLQSAIFDATGENNQDGFAYLLAVDELQPDAAQNNTIYLPSVWR